MELSYRSLSTHSRKAMQADVFEYQLRVPFFRVGGGDPGRVNVTTTDKGVIEIRGPGRDVDDPEWEFYLENYLENEGFAMQYFNALAQLRIVSMNPLTIYHQLVTDEAAAGERGLGLRMSAARIDNPLVAIRRRQRREREKLVRKLFPVEADYPVAELPVAEAVPERAEDATPWGVTRFGDGHYVAPRPGDTGGVPGLSSWVEGPLVEGGSTGTEFDPDVDYPRGALFNMYPDTLFYAFPHRNIYPRIEDLNRMIESGLAVVFLARPEAEEEYTHREVIRATEGFLRDWGVAIVDHVTEERLKEVNLPLLVPGGGSVGEFFVVRRPLEKTHSVPWASMNAFRRRGLAGLPWASTRGEMMETAQPDDGFLAFVREGVTRRLRGNPDVPMRAPLCTILVEAEVREIVAPLENMLGREIPLAFIPGRGEIEIELRSMGEWTLFRGLLRKFI